MLHSKRRLLTSTTEAVSGLSGTRPNFGTIIIIILLLLLLLIFKKIEKSVFSDLCLSHNLESGVHAGR